MFLTLWCKASSFTFQGGIKYSLMVACRMDLGTLVLQLKSHHVQHHNCSQSKQNNKNELNELFCCRKLSPVFRSQVVFLTGNYAYVFQLIGHLVPPFMLQFGM